MPAKCKVLVSRTAVLTAMIVANTLIQIVGTINGAELEGALGWAAVWVAGTVVNGAIFGWIEAVEGI